MNTINVAKGPSVDTTLKESFKAMIGNIFGLLATLYIILLFVVIFSAQSFIDITFFLTWENEGIPIKQHIEESQNIARYHVLRNY